MQLHIERPQPKTESYTIRLTPADRAKAEQAADYLDMPLSVFIRGSIRNMADAVLDGRPKAQA